MAERKCKNCTFYRKNYNIDRSGTSGNCFFNPPTPISLSDDDVFSYLPQVQENDFCSKFDPKTG